jgi:small-conductance mechanosensitive channel
MDSSIENKKIEIDQETLKQLNSTRKWTMFLSILGFIFLGLLILIGIIAGTFLSAFSTGETVPGVPEYLIFVIFLIAAVLYFFPVLFLFRFSKHSSLAVQNLDKTELHKALRNLKSYFAYLGLLIIVFLSLYITLIIITGTSMAFLKGMG